MVPRHALSPRLLQAINFVAWAHDGQYRKQTEIPYVSHLFAVMHLLSVVTEDEDILIAGLAHDTLEDVPDKVSPELLSLTFGPRVREIVEGVTKESTLRSWQERSDAYLTHLSSRASQESVLVSAADKLHNLSSILMDYEEMGEAIWDRFNAPKDRQQWWYRQVYEVARARLEPNSILREFAAKLEVLESL